MPDGKIVLESGEINCIKAAIEPVWYLPGIARRCGTSEQDLRRSLFEHTGGMFPDLVTRPDLQVFLPPIGGVTAYIFGEVSAIADPDRKLACRVHDECNGSDVFGSDICTCRPYLVHGIDICARAAQEGGAGLIVYNRKEGRALGEVTKFLVYNARKRQAGGDTADAYFERTPVQVVPSENPVRMVLLPFMPVLDCRRLHAQFPVRSPYVESELLSYGANEISILVGSPRIGDDCGQRGHSPSPVANGFSESE